MKLKNFPILMLFLMTFSFMSMQKANVNSSDESSRKFWGTELDCRPRLAGDCVVTECRETYYVLWVEVSSTPWLITEVNCN